MKKHNIFNDLTWGDLKTWAGEKILSRGRGYKKQVTGLSRTAKGGLLAWVKGSRRYATTVWIDSTGSLQSSCSCPYWSTCKHAIAVVLVFLDSIKENLPVPAAAKDDERLMLLANNSLDQDEDDPDENRWDDDYDLSGELDEDAESDEAPALTRQNKVSRKAEKIETYLEGLTKDGLTKLVVSLAAEHHSIKESLVERMTLATGDVKKLARSIRREIGRLSCEPAWSNHWSGESSIPDYSGVLRKMKSLLSAGGADELVEIGDELMSRGIEQVEQSNDEGETAMQIGQCMEVVFKAVPQSSLEPAEQILWMIDAFLADQYSLLDGVENPFPKKRYAAGDWSAAADTLLKRLASFASKGPKDDDFSSKYRRESIMRWAITALENSGRKVEIIPLLGKEAPVTFCYERLVDALIAEKRMGDAAFRAREGYEKTVNRYAGIAGNLLHKLWEIAGLEKNHLLVAALKSFDFFSNPDLEKYKALQKAAQAAGVWPAVREAVLYYLETGRQPDASRTGAKQAKGKSANASPEMQAVQCNWPLPSSGLPLPERNTRTAFPALDVLIDIAILEKRNDDIVALYARAAQGKGRFWGGEDKIAAAVHQTHPDTALQIWKRLAESQITLVNPSAYQTAATYLIKMKKLYEGLNRSQEWQAYLSQLRIQHKPKRRLMETLDSLEGRRIIDG